MASVFLIRKAIHLVKRKGYQQSVKDALNAEGDAECKFLCIANAKINNYSNIGLLGRPGIISWIKSAIKDYLGKNQRTFAIVENSQGEKYIIAFNEENLDEIVSQANVDEVFKGAQFDAGFSTNFELSVLNLDSTSVIQGENEDQFLIRPKTTVPHYRRRYFELNIVADPRYANSEKNAIEAKAYLASIACATEG